MLSIDDMLGVAIHAPDEIKTPVTVRIVKLDGEVIEYSANRVVMEVSSDTPDKFTIVVKEDEQDATAQNN